MIYRKIEFVVMFVDGEEPDDSILLDMAFESVETIAAEYWGHYDPESVTVSDVRENYIHEED